MTESRFHFLEADFPCLYSNLRPGRAAAESDVAMMKDSPSYGAHAP